jgi:hypothetical protein
MFWMILGGIGLVAFFAVVLYLSVRDTNQDEHRRAEQKIPLMRKSPLGRWRF